MQCARAREKLALYAPDLILVSPLNRTLLTCSLIFPNPSCPVIVEPLLSEALRSSCDFSSGLAAKK
jgi:broad specificity phosphatase PhoE